MLRHLPLTSDPQRVITKPSSLKFQGILRKGYVVLLLLIVAACAISRPLAVPEQKLTLREALPLSDAGRERVVNFIAAGGQLRDGDTIVTPIPAVEKDFGILLDFLKNFQNLRFIEFEQRLSSVTSLADKEQPVIDAIQKDPDELGRVAFLLRNFWFVFYAQKESPQGDPLPADQWRFNSLAVFRDRPPK